MTNREKTLMQTVARQDQQIAELRRARAQDAARMDRMQAAYVNLAKHTPASALDLLLYDIHSHGSERLGGLS